MLKFHYSNCQNFKENLVLLYMPYTVQFHVSLHQSSRLNRKNIITVENKTPLSCTIDGHLQLVNLMGYTFVDADYFRAKTSILDEF